MGIYDGIEKTEELEFELRVERVVRKVLITPVTLEIRLDADAFMPTQPFPTDAAWDLYVLKDIVIPAGSTGAVPTGVYVNIPQGYEGSVLLRSGLGKRGLSIHTAVYDAGYQGELSSFVHNRGSQPVVFKRGDRVAQFCLRYKIPIEWNLVDSFASSARGEKGHGSSGR